MKILFWFSIGFIFYAYLGYPFCLILLSRLKNRPVKKGNIKPAVSFIIAAFNEEKQIREKIENTLQQAYPGDRFEIIVASDCSTDKTDQIVKSYAPRKIKLVRAQERSGKEHTQKLGIGDATGEILVFSDVATILDPNGVSSIVANFADPTVGCVSSIDKFITKDGTISGEGAYVKYEMLLRKLETRVSGLVGLSGSFFAARREVCNNWSADLQSDFNVLLTSVRLGLRGVTDAESAGYYRNIRDERKEFGRKVRTVARGISVLMRNLQMLNVFRYGLFSWQLFSHKLCRWLVPFALFFVFFANVFLLGQEKIYEYVFVSQCLFYGAAIPGILTSVLIRHPLLKVPTFFVLVNLSILSAWLRYVGGKRIVMWEPSKR